MKTPILTLVVALALGTLAACDRSDNPTARSGSATPSPSAPAGAGSSTPTTPANAGTPSQAEKKEGSNPVQGQVDPKAPEQHKDFQQKGDSAGPKQ